jgi:hypothetical protein
MELARVEFDVTDEMLVTASTEIVEQEILLRESFGPGRRGSLFLAAVGGAGAALIAYFDLAVPELALGFASLSLVVAFMAWPTRAKLRQRIEANVRLAIDKDPAVAAAACSRVYRLTPDYLSVEVPFGETRLAWSAAVRTFETDDYFYVVFPGPSNFPVPRLAFGSDSKYEALCDLIRKLIRSAGGRADDAGRDNL